MDDLTRFDDDFAEAPIEEKSFDAVPDGKYQVAVEKVELKNARSSGNPMLEWTLKILGPKCRGRLLWRRNVMVTRDNIRWLKNDLHVCGLDLAKLSDLPANLDRLLDVRLEVTKQTKGDFENVYLNRRITEAPPQAGPTGGRGPDEDIPF